VVVTVLQIGQYFLERHFAKGRGVRRAEKRKVMAPVTEVAR